MLETISVLKLDDYRRQIQERTMDKYVKQSDGTYICRDCSSVVQKVKVAHPFWNGLTPQSGTGECLYGKVPYCPACEKPSDFHGLPVAPKGSYHNP